MCTVKQRILENLLLTHYLHRVTGDLEPTYCTIGMNEETSGVEEETLVEEPFSSQENDAFKQLHKIATSIDANNNNKKMTTASPPCSG